MAGSLPGTNLKVLNREKETVSLWRRRIRPRRTPGDSDGGVVTSFQGDIAVKEQLVAVLGEEQVRQERSWPSRLGCAALGWPSLSASPTWHRITAAWGCAWTLTVGQRRALGAGVGTLAQPSTFCRLGDQRARRALFKESPRGTLV